MSGNGESKSADNKIKLLYLLYAIGAFVGPVTIAAIILNYVQDDEGMSAVQVQHKRWLKRTFWVSLAGLIVGAILSAIFVGYFIAVATWIWYVYRVIKGYTRYADNRLPKGESISPELTAEADKANEQTN